MLYTIEHTSKNKDKNKNALKTVLGKFRFLHSDWYFIFTIQPIAACRQIKHISLWKRFLLAFI